MWFTSRFTYTLNISYTYAFSMITSYGYRVHDIFIDIVHDSVSIIFIMIVMCIYYW